MLGQNVKRFRTEAGLSLNRLAAAAGLDTSTVWEIERGTQTNPTLSTLEALARALNVSVAELLADPEPEVEVGVAGVAADGDVGAGRGIPAAPASTSPSATPPPPSQGRRSA